MIRRPGELILFWHNPASGGSIAEGGYGLAAGLRSEVSPVIGHAGLQTTLVYLETLPDPLGEMGRVP